MTAEGDQRPIFAASDGDVLNVTSRQVLGGTAHRAPWLVDDLLASALLLGVGAAGGALGVLGLLLDPLVLRAP